MSPKRLTTDAREVILHASQEEARLAGRSTVEAEHILLALATHSDLRPLGLDHDKLVEALEEEEEYSLAAVGIAAGDFEAPARPRGASRPRLATSAKLALQRAIVASSKTGYREITAGHLMHGILAAEQGRVPRALKIAGVDIDELRSKV